ncbi:MAG: signal peptidase I [Bacteroidia bacterium]
MNWKFWKSSGRKSKTREWIDALIFAVIAATLIRTFFIEAFTIPTPSMEEDLMVGDFLFVSKISYGARTPMTPLAFPFAHQELPLVGGKAYSEAIKWGYHRLPGFGKVKNNDCVVFNYPMEDDRPIDKQTHYIKRCIGIPGDTLKIIDGLVYINGKPNPLAPKGEHLYAIAAQEGFSFNAEKLKELGVTTDDKRYLDQNLMMITDDAAGKIRKMNGITAVQQFVRPKGEWNPQIFPDNPNLKWNEDNYGPIYIPKAGSTIQLTPENIPTYRRAITVYEKNQLTEQNGKFFINGKETSTYTFKQGYYWMMGDNRHNSLDSRFWGFVPEDHIVGKAVFIWMSWNSEGSFFSKIRWGRLFNSIH